MHNIGKWLIVKPEHDFCFSGAYYGVSLDVARMIVRLICNVLFLFVFKVLMSQRIQYFPLEDAYQGMLHHFSGTLIHNEYYSQQPFAGNCSKGFRWIINKDANQILDEWKYCCTSKYFQGLYD